MSMKAQQEIKKLINWLKDRIKAPFLNFERAAWTGFWTVIIGSPILIFAFCKNILKTAIEVIKLPTPLWVSIALVIIGSVCIYLKVRIIKTYYKPQFKELNTKLDLFKKEVDSISLTLKDSNSNTVNNIVLYLAYGIKWDNMLNPYCPSCEIPLSSMPNLSERLICSKCKTQISLRIQNQQYQLWQMQNILRQPQG
jgi:hypothetical protein